MLPHPGLCSAHGGYVCMYTHTQCATLQLPWSPTAALGAAARLRARALLRDPPHQAPMGAAKHLHGLEVEG